MGSLLLSAVVPEGCEVYVVLDGTRVADQNQLVGVGVGRSRGAFSVEKWTAVLSPSYNWYFPRETVAFNLGSGHAGENVFTLTLGRHAWLELPKIRIVAVPLAGLQDACSRLGEHVLENAHVSRDRITGTISVPEARFLQFAVPFSPGWKACVDGKETPLMKSDVLYMGVMLDPGEHSVELRYTTPGLTAGCLLSALTLIACCIYTVKSRKKL